MPIYVEWCEFTVLQVSAFDWPRWAWAQVSGWRFL